MPAQTAPNPEEGPSRGSELVQTARRGALVLPLSGRPLHSPVSLRRHHGHFPWLCHDPPDCEPPPSPLLPWCNSALCFVVSFSTPLSPFFDEPRLPFSSDVFPRPPLPLHPPGHVQLFFSIVSVSVCIRWLQRRPDHRTVDVSPHFDPHRTTAWPILHVLVAHPSLLRYQHFPFRSAQSVAGIKADGDPVVAALKQRRAVTAANGVDRYTYSDSTFLTLQASSWVLELEYWDIVNCSDDGVEGVQERVAGRTITALYWRKPFIGTRSRLHLESAWHVPARAGTCQATSRSAHLDPCLDAMDSGSAEASRCPHVLETASRFGSVYSCSRWLHQKCSESARRCTVCLNLDPNENRV